MPADRTLGEWRAACDRSLARSRDRRRRALVTWGDFPLGVLLALVVVIILRLAMVLA